MTMKMHEILKKARTDRNFTQQDIANHLNIQREAYIRYETGKVKMPINHYATLAKFYNVSLDYLAGLIEEERPLKEIQK